MKTGISLLLIMAGWTASFGQNEPSDFVTLDDYLRYAEAHNAGIKSSYYQWQAALEQVPQARSLTTVPPAHYEYFYDNNRK